MKKFVSFDTDTVYVRRWFKWYMVVGTKLYLVTKKEAKKK